MTSLTLAEIAAQLGGTLNGDSTIRVSGANIIRDAGPGDLTFAQGPKHLEQLAASQAAAAIVPRGQYTGSLPVIEVDEPEAAFVQIVRQFRPVDQVPSREISPAADVHPTASIADGVTIAAGVMIAADVRIGAGSQLHSGVQVMTGVTIGENCLIFPLVTLYQHTVIGDRVVLHAGATLGAYGFGYKAGQQGLELCQQLGNVVIEDDVEIGSCSTIDRGTYGATRIGAGTKIDNQVQIGHNCRIGKHNLLCAQVGIAGSTSTGDFVVMAGQVGIKDHVHIGEHVQIGAQAGIMDDLAANARYVGSPAMPERQQMKIFAVMRQLPEMRKQMRVLQRELDELRDGLAGDDQAAQDAA